MTSETPQYIDPVDHFAEWLDHYNRVERHPLKAQSALWYRKIWLSWCQWLSKPTGSRPSPLANWMQATPQDVMLFLEQGLTPAAYARKGKSAPVGGLSQHLYWRVLNALYVRALARGLIARNPAQLGIEERPPLQHEACQVFNPRQWDAIKLALPRGTSPWDVRDRAILFLLMDAALTTAEVCALQRHQVNTRHQRVVLKMQGARTAQERDLQLGLAASVEIRMWLEHRKGMPTPASGPEDVLFVTQMGRALGPRSVLLLVSTTLRKGFADHQMALPAHLGAHSLRNTRLLMWLQEGVPVDEVVRRAGFKDRKSLRALRPHMAVHGIA